MKGRSTPPDEIMATIGNMAESAIVQGNRNLMKQAFMNMVMNHPTDLATLKKRGMYMIRLLMNGIFLSLT